MFREIVTRNVSSRFAVGCKHFDFIRESLARTIPFEHAGLKMIRWIGLPLRPARAYHTRSWVESAAYRWPLAPEVLRSRISARNSFR